MRKKNYRNRGAEPKHYVEPEVVEVEVAEETPAPEKKSKKSAKAAAAEADDSVVVAAAEEQKSEVSEPEAADPAAE